MKKTYIKPTALSVVLDTQNILAGSLGDGTPGRHTVGGGESNSFGKAINGDEWDFDGVEED